MAVSSAQQDECSPLPFGGYEDAMFIDPPDIDSGLLCPVCLLVLREPHLLSCCGKHLCRVCILKVKNGGKPCPCCNGVEFVTMLDKGKNATVLSLKIYCTNKDSGCKWTGELGDSSRHFKERCDYILEDCPFVCGQTLPRHSIEKHKSRQCIKRPIEVQLECLSQDMGERLRTLESRYEDKMAALESNIAILETTIHEQEKKMKEQEKEMEKQLLEQAEHHKQQLEEQKLKFDEKITTIEKKMTQQVAQQMQPQLNKRTTRNKRED